jgi:glutamate racemase
VRIEGFGEAADDGRGLPPFVSAPPLAADAVPALHNGVMPLTGPAVMPRLLAAPTILVFDSGLGGLTVFRELARARPDARYVYVADDAVFPYGGIEEGRLIERVVALMERCIGEHAPDLIVIACNTASTIALAELRRRFSVPFVGTVPAIKPACAASTTRHVSVLGTEATVKREYTRALIREFSAGCAVKLVGSARLAGFAERELAGDPAKDDSLRREIEPCFVDKDGARTDTVVLACTHYPLLLERLEQLAPWPVRWVDPAPAIARRVLALVGPASAARGSASFHFTSGRTPPAALAGRSAAAFVDTAGFGL